MIDLELWKKVDASRSPKEAITHEMFSEMIKAVEEAKMYIEDVNSLSKRTPALFGDQWLDKYFGGIR